MLYIGTLACCPVSGNTPNRSLRHGPDIWGSFWNQLLHQKYIGYQAQILITDTQSNDQKNFMNRIFLASILLMSLICTSCKRDMSPILEAAVSYYSPDRGVVERSLTPAQIQALTDWINRSSDNWGRCLITPPGGPWSVSLHYADGSTSSISLLKFKDEPVSSTIRADHLSGGNLSDQPCALQQFDQSSIDALRTILAIPKM